MDDGSLAESLSDDNQPADIRPRSAKVAPQPTERRIRWQRGELVGKGAFGTVYLGLNLDTGELMAVKMLEAEEVSSRERHALENEVRTLKNLGHPNIVRYLGVDSRSDTLAIFLEYVSGGSLRSLLDRFGRLEERASGAIICETNLIRTGVPARERHRPSRREGGQRSTVARWDREARRLWRVQEDERSQRKHAARDGRPREGHAALDGSRSHKEHRTPELVAQGRRLVRRVYHHRDGDGRPPWSQYSNPVTAMYHIACVEELPEMPSSLGSDGHDFLVLCFDRDPKLRPEVSALLLQRFVAAAPRPLLNQFVTSPRENVLRPSTASATEGLMRCAGATYEGRDGRYRV